MSEGKELAHGLHVATTILHQAFPRDPHGKILSWLACTPLVPHALRPINAFIDLPDLDTDAFIMQLTQVAMILDFQYRLQEAAVLYQQTAQIGNKEVGTA